MRINDKIRVPEVRVISADGEQLGIIATSIALEKAQDQDLDLVELAPNEKPPVCRIMDYGKYRYEKKKKKANQGSHQTKTKEVRFRPKTGTHLLAGLLFRTFLRQCCQCFIVIFCLL